MTSCTVGDLAPAARAALDSYLARVGDTMDADLRDAVVCDLRSWMLDHLDASSTAADVRALAEDAGPVDAPADPDPAPGRLVGSIFGIPYDLRLPSARSLAQNLWDPAAPHLLRPKVFGAGWDLNFGAAAVRLGLIEPDAEDVPFAATPRLAFAAAAVLPVGAAAATVLHYAVRGRSLPADLPSRWSLDGRPDAWTTKRRAAASDLALTLLPAAASACAAASGRPGPVRAAVAGAASGLAVAGALTTVVRPLPERRRPWLGPARALGILGGAGGTLLFLARAGRRAEQRHDLGRS